MQTINEVIFELIWLGRPVVRGEPRVRDKAGATGKNEFRGCKILVPITCFVSF